MSTIPNDVSNTTQGDVTTTGLPTEFTVTDVSDNVSVSALLDAWNSSDSTLPGLGANDDLLTETKEVLFSIQYGLLPFFLVTGLLGNSLSIITMASRHFSHMTSRYILIFLAISDTVLLLTQPFNKLWIMKVAGRDLRALSDLSCKVFFVIFRSSKMTSSWLVVLLCFERFIAVVFPLKVKMILRKRVIFPAIAIDYIFMFIYNSAWSFSSQVVNGVCKPDVPSERHKIFVIFGCCFYSFIPTFLLLVFTPQIIFKLRKQIKVRRTLSRTSTVSKAASKTDEDMIRASFMVLGVMIAYIILIIPITLVHLIAFFKGVSAFDETSYAFFVFREIAQMLEQVNYAVNFFFYVLCSSLFRQRVLDLICLRGFRNRNLSSSGDSRGSKKVILQNALSSSSAPSAE